jgi:competence protein ComEA
MFKKLLALGLAFFAGIAFAAVDVNKASAADLDGVKGIGPALSGRIVDERKKGNFKDWNDFVERVKGIGEGNAAKLSAEGLTVNGSGFKGAAAAPAKKDDKPAVKAEEKKGDAKPAATAAAKDAKPAAAAKDEKAAAKDDKKDAKVAAKDAKPAAAAKDEKAAAKDDKKDAKAKADDKKDTKAKADDKKDDKKDAKKS